MAQTLPKRTEDFSAWYNELVKRAELAENSPVRGCMIIKPYGFAIWEKMQAILDQAFKATGHANAYFPLLIPKSYLSREYYERFHTKVPLDEFIGRGELQIAGESTVPPDIVVADIIDIAEALGISEIAADPAMIPLGS